MKLKLLTLSFLISLLLGCSDKSNNFSEQICKEKYASITVKTEKLYIKTACSQEDFMYGLKNIKQMDYNKGMLFVFNQEQILSFWMKDTCIPLDIAFLNNNLEIVDIKTMNPLDEIIVKSSMPVSYALEVNKDYFYKNNIKIGDKLTLNQINLI